MEIPIKLQVFEGPMDLLMHLLEKNKIDIFDIPIVTITDQYLEYMDQMEQADMNVTSSFLVMACTLLDIKSRMLLPRETTEEGEEEDPREELVRRLLEYKMYKSASEELRVRSIEAGQQFFREQNLPDEVRHYIPPIQYEELIGDTTMDRLKDIFSEVLRRKKSRVDPVRSGFREIPKEEVSTKDKELYIRAYLEKHPHTEFRSLLEAESSKEDVIVTFLVLLELIKIQVIRITQEENGGPILIEAEKSDETAEAAQVVPEAETAEATPAEPETDTVADAVAEEAEKQPVLPAAAPSPVVAKTIVKVTNAPEPDPEPAPESDSEFDPVPESPSRPARRRRSAGKNAARTSSSFGRRQVQKERRLRVGFWKRRKHRRTERR